ncbi:hypothetical protein BD769DRAFT_1675379 [Suillus cothurnatus]|nr:hypothetical protein BD769DRAFT_1675379 [Suillus cothurnatus]
MSAYNNPKADTDRVAMDGDEESGKLLLFVVVTVGNKNTPVSTAQSQLDKPKDATDVCKDTSVSTAHRSDKPKEATNVFNDTSASTAQSESNIAVAPRPCRLGAAKSYTHNHSDGSESSPSDSDWAADEEKHKKAVRPSAIDSDDNGRAKAFDEGDNDKQDYNEEQEVNEDKSDKGPAKKGRLPLEAVSKAQELG